MNCLSKFISFTLMDSTQICDSYKTEKSFKQIRNNVYYMTYIKYQQIENSFYREKFLKNQNTNINILEKELCEFKSYCKKTNFYKFKILSNILQAKIFLIKRKTTEALFIITKALKKLEMIDEDYLKLKLNLTLLEIYTKMRNFVKSKELVTHIELSIDSIGNIIDKYDFYFMQTQFNLINPNTVHYSKGVILRCLEYAVLSNNSGMIKNSKVLLELASTISKISENFPDNCHKINFSYIKLLLNSHLEQLQKLLSMFQNFSLSFMQSLELIRMIQFNNDNTIQKIQEILN